MRANFERAPLGLLVAFIVAGLALWFSDVWLNESGLQHSFLGGFGLFLVIYCASIIRKRRRPSGRA